MTGEPPAGRVMLSVIIPVYNEGEVIEKVISAWAAELQRLGIDYELLVCDDGSTDGTDQVLRRLAARCPRLIVRRHANVGHGPTLLRGYREAGGEWVFQVDSDDEVAPDEFEHLWAMRESWDFLAGYRTHRQAPFSRRMITLIARLVVWALFGRTVHDVNVPYRLIRRAHLHRILKMIPPDAFTPNVIMAGLAAHHGLRIYERPIGHTMRRTGRSSLVKWRLVRGVFRSLAETAAVALRCRRGPRAGSRQDH
ncbi:MAG: glycosyltransferase family 2 protein [Armatimonadetes bacterium]|nr:glycosyltransferase family 2 protein [Armatimonadota bacterium]